jgi:hypothetical protein
VESFKCSGTGISFEDKLWCGIQTHKLTEITQPNLYVSSRNQYPCVSTNQQFDIQKNISHFCTAKLAEILTTNKSLAENSKGLTIANHTGAQEYDNK